MRSGRSVTLAEPQATQSIPIPAPLLPDLTRGTPAGQTVLARALAEPVLKQCGNDFSREHIMQQVANIRDLTLPVLLPGIKVNTSPTNFHPIRQMQLQRWNGSTWERFGSIIEGANVYSDV